MTRAALICIMLASLLVGILLAANYPEMHFWARVAISAIVGVLFVRIAGVR